MGISKAKCWGLVGGLWLVVGLLVGCGADGDAMLGATPGGAQDNGLAEDEIASGNVPQPEDITVEGMLATRDFPLAERSCSDPLCIGAAYAIAPTLDRTHAAAFVQIGFASGFDAATFERSPLNLAVVVDRSGSMEGEKIAAVRTALSRLIDQLGPADRLAIVLFDDQVDVLWPSSPVTNREAVREVLPMVVARGSTDLATGLAAGYAEVAAHTADFAGLDRVMVLTDAIANTGTTEISDFVSLAQDEAEQDVGLTVFGVGTDLNQDLVLAISALRGGNYFYLSDAETIATVFDVDFDYLVTPLAYDLHFSLVAAAGFRISDVYGHSSSPDGQAMTIDVATVFLSRGHGAVVARLEPIEGWPAGKAPLASLSLTYQPAAPGAVVTETSQPSYDGEVPLSDELTYFPDPNIRRTVAFVNAALGESTACAAYHNGNVEGAVALLDATEALLRAEATTLGDDELTAEADLVVALRANMTHPTVDRTYDDYDEYDDDDGGILPMACSTPAPYSHAPPALVPVLAALVFARTRSRRSDRVTQKPRGGVR